MGNRAGIWLAKGMEKIRKLKIIYMTLWNNIETRLAIHSIIEIDQKH